MHIGDGGGAVRPSPSCGTSAFQPPALNTFNAAHKRAYALGHGRA